MISNCGCYRMSQRKTFSSIYCIVFSHVIHESVPFAIIFAITEKHNEEILICQRSEGKPVTKFHEALMEFLVTSVTLRFEGGAVAAN